MRVTDDITLDFGYNAHLIDASSNNITVTLPIITGDGPNFFLARIDTSGNTVTIDGNGATINGSSTVSMNTHDTTLLVMSADNWYTLGGTWLS